MRFRRAALMLGASAVVGLALVATFAVAAIAAPATTNVCPNGSVNFGVEPYDTGAQFTGAYDALTGVLAKELNCPVNLIITDNAELKGQTVAFSDPGSTSGNLMPRYAMIQAGLNPGEVKIEYAGSHPAALLALVNGKVDAGEINSQQQATATAAHQFDAAKFRVLWRSPPIENDPITVRGNLSPAFKAAIRKALLEMKPSQLKLVDAELGVNAGPMVAAKDSLYNPIRAIVKAENISITDIG